MMTTLETTRLTPWSELKNRPSLSHTHIHTYARTHAYARARITHNQPCASLDSLGFGAIRSYMTVGLTLADRHIHYL